MHKPLTLLSLLLLPAGSLCLLMLGGSLASRQTGPPLGAGPELSQRKPAGANSHRLAVLRRQYRCYQLSRDCPAASARAAAHYNQCVDDSDPSALRGTGLPRYLPVP